MSRRSSEDRVSVKPSRSRILWIAGVLAVAAAASFLIPRPPAGAIHETPGDLQTASAAGFNVLLITLDTTRADRLACYGYRRGATPRLDALASTGVRFDHAVTTAPVTLPAHCSILTGLYPPNHGVRNNAEFRLGETNVTLAEVLRDRGYETAAFIASFVLDARFGLNQGFDHYDDRMPVPERGFGQDQERSASAITDAAIGWLERREAGKPFFAWVHYYDPHAPYLPHEPRFNRAPYDGEIAFMDAQFGRFVDAVDAHSLRDNTLIIVVGDHGESLGEHSESGHSRLIYDAVMRVPLIVSCPPIVEREVVGDVTVCVTDIFPTVLELLGIEPDTPSDGVSLLDARDHPDRSIYMEGMVTYLDNGWAPLFGMRDRFRKVIQAPQPEYYDLSEDPGELDNLYGKLAKTAAARYARLESELSELLTDWPTPEEVAGAGETLDQETIDRLASLGYMSGDTAPVDLGKLDPKEMMPTWEKMGEAKRLSARGDQRRAIDLLAEVIRAWPNDRTALRQLGMAHLRAGDRGAAEEHLRKAIDIKPAADVCLLLAQIMVIERRFDETEPLLALALSVDPRHGGVYVARGDLLAMQNRHAEALVAYETAQRLDPYRSQGVVTQRIERLRSAISP